MRRILLLALAGLAPALAGPGLVATYSDGAVTLREVVPTPNFYLAPGETLHPALEKSFGAVFRGRLSIHQNGRYELFPGVAELEIDNRPVSGPRFLTAGDHELQLRYSSDRGGTGVRLEWQGPGFPREPVPARLFTHDDAEAPREAERLAETGRLLAAELGCANCHLAAPTLAKRPGPPLDGIGSRTNPAWLKHWLDNPQAFRATATMPRAAHRSDANDLAEYLMTLAGDPPAEPQTDAEAGAKLFQGLGCVACHGKKGVALDGLGSKTTAGHLQGYLLNPFVWEPSGRMPALDLDGRQAADLAGYLVQSKKPDFERQPLGGDAERGRGRFENAGCVACHQLEGAANHLVSPEMAALDPERGCLSDNPAEPAPIYALKPSQRDALRAFIAFYKANPDRTRAPIHDFRSRLEQLRCNACHEVEGLPASVEGRQPAPSLTGLGLWMEAAAMRRALSEPSRTDGPLEARMPQYHPQHVGAVSDGFAKAAGVAPGSAPLVQPPSRPVRERTEAQPSEPAREEPLVIRRDLPEAADALVVRLSNEISYAFDPGEVRLLYAWREPEGVFYRQTAFPIRIGDPERIPLRIFVGYETIDGAPEIHYQADGLDIYERILLRNGELVRQFRLPTVDQPMWLFVAAAEGARITTSLGSGLERLQLPRGENIRFEIRIAAP